MQIDKFREKSTLAEAVLEEAVSGEEIRDIKKKPALQWNKGKCPLGSDLTHPSFQPRLFKLPQKQLQTNLGGG